MGAINFALGAARVGVERVRLQVAGRGLCLQLFARAGRLRALSAESAQSFSLYYSWIAVAGFRVTFSCLVQDLGRFQRTGSSLPMHDAWTGLELSYIDHGLRRDAWRNSGN